MELLLLACLLAYAAGSQSEQTRLGMTPADRDLRREEVRHKKAVQRIADKHGITTPTVGHGTAGTTREKPATTTAGPAPTVVTIPDAFRAGYRAHTPLARVTTPVGHRAGEWAAHGIAWARGTGKNAVARYRERRKAEGKPDPAPILVPPPPDYAPTVGTAPSGTEAPAGPREGPPEGVEGGSAGSSAPDGPQAPTRPSDGAESAPHAQAPEPPPVTDVDAPEAPEPAPAPAHDAEEKATAPAEDTGAPAQENAAPDTEPEAATDAPDTPTGAPETPQQTEGVGRMAAEVSYESVRDESDEMSIMCEEDSDTYDRMKRRCEREVGKADELIAALSEIGAGEGLVSKVLRCSEQYQLIGMNIGDLQANTVAQGEAVRRAKDLLMHGQGYYHGIAVDSGGDVAEREYYLGDTVDSEDLQADNETYELKGA